MTLSGIKWRYLVCHVSALCLSLPPSLGLAVIPGVLPSGIAALLGGVLLFQSFQEVVHLVISCLLSGSYHGGQTGRLPSICKTHCEQ